MKALKLPRQPAQKPQQLEFFHNVAEVKVSYVPKFKAAERPVISSSRDAYAILSNLWDDETLELFEQFYILLINCIFR